MQVQVTFYGVLKQTTGVRAQTLDLPETTRTVGDVIALLVERHPALGPLLGSVAYVVSDDLVNSDHLLRDGDDLGLLPPVSGG